MFPSVLMACNPHCLVQGLWGFSRKTPVLQEEGLLLVPKRGLLSNTWKWIVQGDTLADKQETLLGRGARESRREREPRRTAKSRGLQSWVLWWCGKLLSCLWPIILTLDPSWWCMNCSAKMDSSEKGSGRWYYTWLLLLTFPELFQLVEELVGGSLVRCSLQGPPVMN